MMNKSLYGPVKDQFLVLAEYVMVLEGMGERNKIENITLLLNLIDSIRKQCEIYLKYELSKESKGF